MSEPTLTDPWIPENAGSVWAGAVIEVFWYDQDPEADPMFVSTDRLVLLPNVQCMFIEQHEGTDPGTAGFRYSFNEIGPNVDPEAPVSVEQAFDTNYALLHAVGPTDRLIVRATRWDGYYEYLFDGFPVDFQASLDGTHEGGEFSAQGVAKRLWDAPIPGAVMRYASYYDNDINIQTDIPAQFNARGLPNRTADGSESDAGNDRKYHVFVDPTVNRSPDVRDFWNLNDAVKYLLYTLNADEKWVKNPEPDLIDSLLVAKQPKPGEEFDPNDAETYDTAPIRVSDKPITGRDWPTVLHDLLRNKGFGTRYLMYESDQGSPYTQLDLYSHETEPVKSLYLQARGGTYDPFQSNTAKARVARDFSGVANVWTVQGRLERHEVTFVLYPMFPMSSGDSSAANLPNFDANAILTTPANRPKYRYFGVCEATDQWYRPGSSTGNDPDFSFDDVFGEGNWAARNRKPLSELITLGPDQKPRQASLAISTDYTPPGANKPHLWGGGGVWLPVAAGHGWSLLPDRVGIRITATNPNAWNVGKKADGSPYVVKLVESLAAGGNLWLRLTCVIEGDRTVKGTAKRLTRSPLTWDIERVIDARDRIRKDVIHTSSEYYPASGTPTTRDDTAAAEAEAAAYRSAADLGVLQGAAMIPYVTTHYPIGTRVDGIAGRALGFRTDGGDSEATAVYPIVEGVRWDFDANKQTTTLFLSDESLRRHSIERKLSR